MEISDAPSWLLAGTGPSERPSLSGTTARDSLLAEAFALAGMLGDPMPNGNIAVHCPWANEHTSGSGRGKDSSSVVLPPIAGTTFGSFICLHSHCSHRRWSEVMAILPPAAVVAAKQKFPLKPMAIIAASKVQHVAEIVEDGSDEIEIAAPQPMGVRQLLRYGKNSKGEPYLVPDLTNLITILSMDPKWLADDGKPLLRYDSFTQQLKFKKAPPWHPADAPAISVDYWRDQDVGRMISWVKRDYEFDVKENQVHMAIGVVGHRFATHPVKEWLTSLTWDGKPRVATWLTKYFGVREEAYSKQVGIWWLVSAIARVMRPGCKADHVLILEGPQGIRKSTALATLCWDKAWFNDTPFDLGSKDAYLSLRGKFIVELAELDSLTRAETSRAKAFFASEADTFRPPYGRESVTLPRQCVFAGSVNHETYLQDETGNRRYWPVRCGKIDIDALLVDREQLWAEAAVMFASGQLWWPETTEEKELCRAEQSDREDEDIWQPIVRLWLEEKDCSLLTNSRKQAGICPLGYLTTTDVGLRALGIEKHRLDKYASIRIGKIMKSLGWGRARIRVLGERVYAFTKV